MLQRIRDRGVTVTVTEWAFTSQSVGRPGATLHMLLRNHRLALPSDQELHDELATVRLGESAPGVLWLDHDAGRHDDRAVSLGLAALSDHPDTQSGGFSIPSVILANRQPRSSAEFRLASRRGTIADIAAVQRSQTAAQRRAGIGLVVPGSANDPRRVKRV